jgi:hypothetical protein
VKPTINQEKLEFAVLWSLARENYDEAWADVPTIRSHLLNIAMPQQISASVRHLVECGMVIDRSAPMQEHFEASREGHILIDQLSANPKTFVSRLNAWGPKWLSSGMAQTIQLHAQIAPTQKVRPMADDNSGTRDDRINIQVNPTIHSTATNNSPAPERGDVHLARSGVTAGWANVWVAVTVGIIVILVTLWAALK